MNVDFNINNRKTNRMEKKVTAKYIDAEKLKAKIERCKGYISVTHFAEELLSFIDSLQQEPTEGIKGNLEEIPSMDLEQAAKKIAYDVCKDLPQGEEKDGIVYYSILAAKAGAEWQFERIVKWLEDNLCEEVNLHLASYAEAKYVTDNIIGGLKRAFREEDL